MTSSAAPTRSYPATLSWQGDVTGTLRMIDQTLLPAEYREIECDTVEKVWEAIRALRVRGAPAIGVAVAYGVVLGLQSATQEVRARFDEQFAKVKQYLAGSRPTAVNLFWALDRLERVAQSSPSLTSAEMLTRLLSEAREIEVEDREMCRRIGEVGAELLQDGQGVLTHCNAGGL